MLGDRMRDLREEKGVSQEELAAALGITRLSVGNYERGQRKPDAEMIVKIARYFDVSADYLLGLSEVRTNSGKSMQEEMGLSEAALETLRGIHEDGFSEVFNKVVTALPFLFALDQLRDALTIFPMLATEDRRLVHRLTGNEYHLSDVQKMAAGNAKQYMMNLVDEVLKEE